MWRHTRRLLCFLALLALAAPGVTVAQDQFINGHLILAGRHNLCLPAGGTNAYACSYPRAITAYQLWTKYAFVPDVANTGAATLAVQGLAAKTIKKLVSGTKTDLAPNDLRPGAPVEVYYDGTDMLCLSCGGGSGSPGTAGRPAYFPATGTTVDDATGLTFTTDGTTLASLKYRVTTKSASATLGPADGPIVACTAAADVTLTLPAASSEQGVWTIIKVDGGAGACKVARGGSDTINGGTSTVDATAQWQRIDMVQASTTNWASVLGVLWVNLATQVTGDLPYANLTPATAASKLLGRGDSSAGDWQEVTLGANLAMTGTTLSAAGDVTDVWACTTGNCSALTAAAGDTLDAGSATAASPTTRSTAVPGTCTEGQHHQDTDAGGSETYVCTAANTWTKLAAVTDSLNVFAATTSAQLAGVLSDEAGTGVVVLNVRPPLTVQDSTFVIQDNGDNTKQAQFMAGAILTGTTRTYTLPDANITVAGVDTANAWADGVRQTFNPSGTTPGLNVGAQAGDPSTPTNGDLWYDSTANELTARINGANVALGGSSLPATALRSINIPAGSMDVTGGCITNDPAALVANGPRLPTITCIDDNAASIEFNFISADAWNAGTITIQLHASNTAAETTALVMHFAGVCVSSGEALAAHSTSGEQAVTLTWTNLANQEVFAATPTPITLQGTCAAGDHVYMRGQVDITGTTVANMATVRLLGVKVRYTNVTALEFP